MRVWNWLAWSRAETLHEREPAAERGGGSGQATTARPSPAEVRVPVEARIVERVRSVDGLNHWQQQQVREIVREELAAFAARLESAGSGAPTERARRPRVHRWPEGGAEAIKPLMA